MLSNLQFRPSVLCLHFSTSHLIDWFLNILSLLFTLVFPIFRFIYGHLVIDKLKILGYNKKKEIIMKVVLIKDVKGSGKAGDIIEAK
ncbi:MAG: hypothetical protein J6R83_04745, partial [Clostridia bacterium]|nr:hypothetical protein [Clostridia bacterium]